MNSKDFFQKVYKVVKMIPSGRVSTYGLIAKYLGSEKSSRVVGYAMNASHQNSDIPAHRVVNRVGLLTGKHHFSKENSMINLLLNEGVTVIDNKVVDFDEIFWNPSKELEL